ncbi:FAD:protein FMN transferase [Phenylobacterium sp. SCN 70-31]|uniref:FAD:protein FMN transferase n=1 Tax=Phenylobacterium sp. SCN 70-31 TaxID=1660129 RepID=UPI00086F31D4|nr:FAD:protein FMN transferase [Phenylobacterium sp. SCN 70-31]ODT86966.1 MAG: thiamine biosynthesis protein ApbE [Phenylobacterium sp. SCN 70-31]
MRPEPTAPRRIAVPLALGREAARPREGRDVVLQGPTMGVSWRLRARAPSGLGDETITAVVQGACDAVVAAASTWEPESEITRFNRAPAGVWVPVGEHLMAIVRAAVRHAEESGGAFDPAVGRLTDLWGFGPPGAVVRPPSVAELAAAETGWRDLEIDAVGMRLLQPGGLSLDLSGIAKGYGVDLAASALAGLGVRDALLEIGGELSGRGVKGDGEPWWVEVERPPEATSDTALEEPPVLIALHELCVATSGDWRRRFEAGGRRYSHTLDPATRAPVDGQVAAVTVVHERCMEADALCTVLTVMGPERALAFAEARDVAALLLVRTPLGHAERLSPAFRRLLD